jgi:uncharacterized protein involved in exopolysaccharide biosynthesis
LILDRFMRSSYERSQEALRRAGAFLDQQISSYADLISQSQAEIAASRRRWGADVADASEAAPYQQERAAPEPLVLPPAPPPAPSEATQRAAQLEAKLASLLAVDTDQHPDVIAARKQLEAARAEEGQEMVQVADAPQVTAPISPHRRVQVRRRLGPPPEVAAELAELQRKDELLRASYQQLVGKRAAAQMSEAVSGADRAGKFLVTREPARPTAPVGPNRPLYLAAGLLAAVGAGLGVGYLRGVILGIMVSPREFEEIIQLPVIGTISLEGAWRTHPPFSPAFDFALPLARRQRRLRVNDLSEKPQ